MGHFVRSHFILLIIKNKADENLGSRSSSLLITSFTQLKWKATLYEEKTNSKHSNYF